MGSVLPENTAPADFSDFELARPRWPLQIAARTCPVPLEMAARACPGATRALETAARACPGATRTLEIADRGHQGRPEHPFQALWRHRGKLERPFRALWQRQGKPGQPFRVLWRHWGKPASNGSSPSSYFEHSGVSNTIIFEARQIESSARHLSTWDKYIISATANRAQSVTSCQPEPVMPLYSDLGPRGTMTQELECIIEPHAFLKFPELFRTVAHPFRCIIFPMPPKSIREPILPPVGNLPPPIISAQLLSWPMAQGYGPSPGPGLARSRAQGGQAGILGHEP